MKHRPRHFLHLDVLGPVEAVVSQGTEESRDIVALIHGELGERPLVRIHSRCLYGEVFGSRDCDCRVQLMASLHLIASAGSGIIIYLDQEGRGAGLFGKAQGYELSQRLGIDSFAAYELLELEADMRRYSDAAEMLNNLGVAKIKLLTNNPEKIKSIESRGIDVIRVPLDPSSVGFEIPDEARAYIKTKHARGHFALG